MSYYQCIMALLGGDQHDGDSVVLQVKGTG